MLRLRVQRAYAVDACSVEIQADHATARGLEELHRDLPDQTETDHRDAIPELRPCPPKPLQCDSAEGRRRGVLEVAPRRHPADQVARHYDVVGVIGLAGAGRGDTIADSEIGDTLTHRDDL